MKFTKVIAEIVRIEGDSECTFGHKVGEKFEFTEMGCSRKMCIYALEALLPAVNVLLHGGWFPWAKRNEIIYWGCPHPGRGQLIFKLTVKK